MKSGCKSTLMVFIGIFIGIVIALGGVAAAGFWAYNNLSINKLEQLTGQEIIDIGDYNDKPIKDLISEIGTLANSTVSELDNKLLNGSIKSNLRLTINGKIVDLGQSVFADILNSTPSVAISKLGQIKNKITFGVIYNDILKAINENLPDSAFSQKYKNTSIETFLKSFQKEKIYTIFEADKNFGNDLLNTFYNSIKNLNIEDISNEEKMDTALDSMKVNQLLGLTSASTGVLGALYSKDLTMGELKKDNSFDDLSINDILELDNTATGVLKAIYEKNWTLKDLKVSTNFSTLNLSTILNIDSSATGIFGAIRDRNWTLGDLTNANLNSLTLGEIIGITSSSPKILQALQNSTLNSLNSDTENLRLGNIIDLEEFDYDSNNDGTMDSYKGVLGLLFETDSTNENGPKIIDLETKINTLNSLIFNKQLKELVNREIITIENYDAKKDKDIAITSDGGPVTKKLEDLTLQEFINYAVSVIPE